jgi:DNA-binding CsgD family transcriptional regulator
MAKPQADLLEIVEAGYEVDASDEDWVKQLAAKARPHVDQGFGLAAFEYYMPEGQLPQMVQSYHLGIPDNLAAIYSRIFDTMPPDIRIRPFRMGPCIAGSQMMGKREKEFLEEPHMKRFAQTYGVFDSLWITAMEPTGRGCGFHSSRPKVAWATPSQIQRWGRVAGHLSTAVRLRYRMKTLRANNANLTPDAVLDPNGKVHHASGDASMGTALDQLRSAVRVLEKSRGPMRLKEPDKSLAGWKALVSGRWSLIDQIENDGRRYIVARENEPLAPGPDALTAREKQVIGYAKLGHHNKLIAYELGIADSTVRVLLARAAAKLGVRTRDDLLRTVPEFKVRPNLPRTAGQA